MQTGSFLRSGERTLKCVLTIGTRSAQSIMASGHCAAQTGRTHDRIRPMLQPRQKVLAKAPSRAFAMSAFGPKADVGSQNLP